MSPSISVVHRTAVLPPALADRLGPEERLSWLAPHQNYGPRLVLVEDRASFAAALVTGRPHTASLKVARVVVGSPAAEDALVAAVVRLAQESGVVSLRVEGDAVGAIDWGRHGFASVKAPSVSGPGTETGAAAVLWFGPIPHSELGYYRQTTEYTCGPCSLLMAMASASDPRLNHRFEYNLWRQANNFPASDPLGLAVVARGFFRQVEVYLSTAEPTLLEGVTDPGVLALKVEMQAEHRAEVDELAIPVRQTAIDFGVVADRLSQGWRAFLLIDSRFMHVESWPHWIVAHAHQDGVFLVDDPWVYVGRGETWVDGHDLAIRRDDLETMTWFGTPAYRGVILVKV